MDVLVRRNKKTRCTSGRVEYRFDFLGINYFHNEINDIVRGTELPGVSLVPQDGKQVLKNVA